MPLTTFRQPQYFSYLVDDVNMEPIVRGADSSQDRCRVRPERSLVDVKSKLCLNDGCEMAG
jgi:hypothetical protein